MEVKTNSYQDLILWQKSMDFSVKVYQITEKFPADEKFGLISQINRAVVSIPSNIAEGAGRDSKKEFSQFLSIALGSSYEAQTQLILAHRIGFISAAELKLLSEHSLEIQKMIFGLKKSIASRLN
ncbi:MAG: four helix bundle protein [Chitinophagales bacterium]